ncbi:MAG: hypothetical protein QM579_09685 [Desulfovibrio sp.]|uniref:radical SAM protein n=1 Tax=Desulfovibrio sp. TaxID=885 RepID=UPI0039E5F998
MRLLDHWDDMQLEQARELSWARHGKKIVFYLPGMFVRDGVQGQYPALSVTGRDCAQHCAHCGGALLQNMPDVSKPGSLLEKCRSLEAQGVQGVLLSGGCDGRGRVPWKNFIRAIADVKQQTGLFVSVHCGMVDAATARDLKNAGADQALIDVIGSAETYYKVYHLADGAELLDKSLEALARAELPVVPHIVVGLHFGKLLGESWALDIIARRPPALLVIVACMSLPGTDMAHMAPPGAREVCGVILRAHELMPDTEISLGCARPRKGAADLEELALMAGVNRMALPSQEAVATAARMGLEAQFRKTCCSVRLGEGAAGW